MVSDTSVPSPVFRGVKAFFGVKEGKGLCRLLDEGNVVIVMRANTFVERCS